LGGGVSNILAALLTVMDQEHADGLVAHRKSLRKPLTLFAAQMLIKEYKRFGDANLAVEEQVLRGWVGFKSEWVQKTGNAVRTLTRAEHMQEELRQRILNEQHEQNAARGFDLAADELFPRLPAERIVWRH
jgi:hypothetical protein